MLLFSMKGIEELNVGEIFFIKIVKITMRSTSIRNATTDFMAELTN